MNARLASLARLAVILTLAAVGLVATADVARAQCGTWADDVHAAGTNGFGVKAWAVFDDGNGPHLYAAGDFSVAGGVAANGIARWNGTSFEALAAQPNGHVHALIVWDDGSGPALFAGGDFTTVGASPANRLAKYRAGAWSAVGTGVDDGDVLAFDVFDDGSGAALFVGGSFAHVGGQYRPGITRWNGSSFTFVPGVQGDGSIVAALVHHDDGSGPALYAGGSFAAAGGVAASAIARWNGTTWSAVGSMPVQVSPYVGSLAVHATGGGAVLVAGGTFRPIAGNPSKNVAVWNGSTWNTMGDGLEDPLQAGGIHVESLASIDLGDGQGPSLFAGGSFTRTGSVAIGSLARWNGASWSDVGVVGRSVRNLFGVVDAAGARLHVGGSFAVVGDRAAGGVAVLDATGLSPLDEGTTLVPGSAVAFASLDDGSGEALYVAGLFRTGLSIPYEHVGRFDGTRWTVLKGWTPESLTAMTAFDDGSGAKLYAAGYSYLAQSLRVGRWNGGAWEALPSSTGLEFTTGEVHAMTAFDDGTGPALYVAGRFRMTDLVERRVVRWKNGTWSTLGTLDGWVETLAVHDDGSGRELYAGGFLTPSAVVRWSGGTWTVPGSGVSGNLAIVRTLVSFDDGSGPTLIAGGSFTNAGGQPIVNLAAWKNGAWSALPGGVSHDVTASIVHDDGRGNGDSCIVGGHVDLAGSGTVTTLQSWDGVAWTTIGTFAHPTSNVATVTALASTNLLGSRDLFVGGAFLDANGVYADGLAYLRGCGETGETFCFGDGSATVCPCGNASNVGERAGCRNSLGLAGALRARGEPSLSQDTLRLDGSAMPDSPVLYYQGEGVLFGGAGVVSGDGLKCAGGPFVRLGTQLNVGGASSHPSAGGSSISVRGFVGFPGARTYQAWYRDSSPSYCTPAFHDVTNAVRVVWRP